ncbi:hypothetical protein [Vibrio mangrovi]|uniref:Uncharacterized protein n=1 Tax=Vibrio mangrovi TaxID=474394 RepID=A0A1Y6IS32_9VIBR|nr:hypothetical protein [Vibrio mangrovi]MDW6003598.1 hypothetical protein [Vibrio mangrovi]SMR99610.1 hypothetical protein VIM7927_00837 [Vibrio mangrovi]
MDPVKAGSTTLYSPQSVKAKQATPATQSAQNKANELTKVEQNKVTLSAEGKALLAALQEIDKENKAAEGKSVGDKVESFTYGALGMEHPEKLKEEDDSSYSAGQYLSAAATIGSILLAIA